MIDPCDRLARLDEAFATPGSDLPVQVSNDPDVCDTCRSPVRPLPGAQLSWCARCRRAYVTPGRRFLCHMPVHWSAPKFTTFWGRGLTGLLDGETDRSFVDFLARRVAPDTVQRDRLIDLAVPRPILLGELAREHGLLAAAEVEWILDLQRSTPAHRRRCFGAIAVELGLWRPRMVPRLLAAQAERTRGAAVALSAQLGISEPELLAAERAFFGLAECAEPAERWPICDVLAEDEPMQSA